MGLITGFIQASAALAAEASQIAGRNRNRQQAIEDDRSGNRTRSKRVVDGVELTDAVHSVPENTSEETRQEHRRKDDGQPVGVRKVDLTV